MGYFLWGAGVPKSIAFESNPGQAPDAEVDPRAIDLFGDSQIVPNPGDILYGSGWNEPLVLVLVTGYDPAAREVIGLRLNKDRASNDRFFLGNKITDPNDANDWMKVHVSLPMSRAFLIPMQMDFQDSSTYKGPVPTDANIQQWSPDLWTLCQTQGSTTSTSDTPGGGAGDGASPQGWSNGAKVAAAVGIVAGTAIGIGLAMKHAAKPPQP